MVTDLFAAIDRNSIDEVEALLSGGADPNVALSIPPYWLPLEAAIEQEEHGGTSGQALNMVQLLIDHGADVNAWDREHHLTPLLKAMDFENRDVIQALIRAGADPNETNREGLTSLKWAVSRNDVELVDLLLRHGAARTIDMQSGIYTRTALQMAARRLNLPIIRLLLQAGADTEAVDEDSRPARRRLPQRVENNAETWDEAYELLSSRRSP
jgi:ankyrin repeat protein